MKLDQEIFRNILITAEKLPTLSTTGVDVFLDDYKEVTKNDLNDSLKAKIKEHLLLAIEEGFLKADFFDGSIQSIKRLTLKGHHFVAATREDHIWNVYTKSAADLYCEGSIIAITNLIDKRINSGKW